MKRKMGRFVILGSLMLALLLLFAGAGAEEKAYVLDATADLTAMEQGERNNGDTEMVKDYFTIMYSQKNKIDGSNKKFDDGYTATQRLNFGGKTQPGSGMINSVRFTTEGSAQVKFWWVSGGDGRQFALYDAEGDMLQQTRVDSIKNSLYISQFDVPDAGTYYLGVPQGSNYLFKLQVTEIPAEQEKAPRADWAQVNGPEILAVQDLGDGTLQVQVTGTVGYDGADGVTVFVLDAKGKEVASRSSLAEKDAHTIAFVLPSSGEYTCRAVLYRENEADKQAEYTGAMTFRLPLGVPVISGVASLGGGSVEVTWTQVPEADYYEVYADGVPAKTVRKTAAAVSGLTMEETHAFTVRALRGEEKGEMSQPFSAVATKDAQQAWFFTVFGPSTNEKDNGYIGSLNEDGFVTVYSENGKGKIQPNADDGVAFYYTKIPTSQNFTLRAKVHVDNWDYSNGQEGFGLMAMDSVPPMGTESFFTNQLMAVATKIEYYWQGGKVSESGTKYTMRLGLGVLEKLGHAPGSTTPVFGRIYTLENAAARMPQEGVTNYNIIGNNTNRETLDKTAYTLEEKTDFVLEIQKNNTGYFVTYYDENGKIIGQHKNYDTQALSVMDADYIYAGFFAARRARATFSDVEFVTIDPLEDAAAEERPVEEVQPTFTIVSAATSGKQDYVLSCVSNVKGSVNVSIQGEKVLEGQPLLPEIRNDYLLTLPRAGETLMEVKFTPDKEQDLGEDRVLKSVRSTTVEHAVVYTNAYAALETIYVSPSGTSSGKGTKESPLNVQTAVNYAQSGQTILLAGGTYNFVEPLRIPHGIDGTADAPIRMMVDPMAESRPVLDFKGLTAGVIHGGDYWHFFGFDVTNTRNGQKGFQVSGHYNTLERIDAYHNGNTGIQISRYAGTDPVSEWPSHNLILNCTSYGNADAGYEDADGFAAKLTCGEGNVFRGCIAHHNADDGYDLYAKIETGPIGKVRIESSVAYANGFLEDGSEGGNGNGFKMGGSNIPGGHQLIDSYAFFNKSKGIDSNSCPDMVAENCVSYNNLRYNVAFYTNIQQDTAYRAQGLVSFKDDTIPGGDASEGDHFKPKGAQNPADYLNDSCYYWTGTEARNASGETVTEDFFESLTFTGADRLPDGSIDLHGFLQRK